MTSSHKLFREFVHLRQQYLGQHLWARSYYVATNGTVTDEIIKEYIENQDLGISDDDFRNWVIKIFTFSPLFRPTVFRRVVH